MINCLERPKSVLFILVTMDDGGSGVVSSISQESAIVLHWQARFYFVVISLGSLLCAPAQRIVLGCRIMCASVVASKSKKL